VKATTLTFLLDEQTHHIYVSVCIGGRDIDLCRFTDAAEAGAYASKWVANRGLCFAPDSARRIAEAQRLDSIMLTLDVITRAQYELVTEVLRNAWVDESEGILPWPFIPAH
jgi:hypothetical protein